MPTPNQPDPPLNPENASLNSQPSPGLNTLREQWDAMLARMQTPEARRVMQATFDASPEELARAANAACRKRN